MAKSSSNPGPLIDESSAIAAMGLGLQLASTRSIADALGLSGVTDRHVRILMRTLNVPILHLGPNEFVDLAEFVLSLKAALSEGSPDLHVPIPRPNSKRPYSPPSDCRFRSSLPPGTVASALPDLCRRILAAREISGAPTQSLRSVRTWLAAAADRISMEAGRTATPVPVPATPSRHTPLSTLIDNPPEPTDA